jgi:hypothetical protein
LEIPLEQHWKSILHQFVEKRWQTTAGAISGEGDYGVDSTAAC